MNNDKKALVIKISTIVAVIGFVACFASFIIALFNSKYIISIIFLLSAIYCISHFVSRVKNKN